jgi:hypothetical protein
MSHSDKQIQIPLTVNGNYRWISVTVEPTILEQVQKGLSLTSQYRLVIESKQPVNPSLAQNTIGIDNSFRNTTTIHTDMTPVVYPLRQKNATSKSEKKLLLLRTHRIYQHLIHMRFLMILNSPLVPPLSPLKLTSLTETKAEILLVSMVHNAQLPPLLLHEMILPGRMTP